MSTYQITEKGRGLRATIMPDGLVELSHSSQQWPMSIAAAIKQGLVREVPDDDSKSSVKFLYPDEVSAQVRGSSGEERKP